MDKRTVPEPGPLKCVLGPFDATCVVVGAIIGVGIFFTPSRVAELSGSSGAALLAWVIAAGIAVTGALTFAELGGLYPKTAGQYEMLRDAYGPLPAFLFVFCNATAVQAGAMAIIAIVFARHLCGALGNHTPAAGVVLAISATALLGLALANSLGVRWGSGIQNATVCAKVATLLVVTCLAIFAAAEPADLPEVNAVDQTRAPTLLLAALVPALFSFGGWQHGLWIGGEIRRPERNVPLAIISGVVLVVVVYLLVNWAYFRLLGYEAVATSSALAADAVAVVWPGYGRRVVAGAVAVSAFGVLNAQLLAGPRLIYGMARDGRFFKTFAHTSKKFGTPLPAIALLAAAALALLLIAGENAVNKLLTGVVFVDGVFFVLTGLTVFVFRRKSPQARRSIRVPGYPVVPLLFVIGEIGILIGAYQDPAVRQAALVGAAWIASAAVCYLLFFRTRQS